MKSDKNIFEISRHFPHSWNYFTQAALVVLVTNIMSGFPLSSGSSIYREWSTPQRKELMSEQSLYDAYLKGNISPKESSWVLPSVKWRRRKHVLRMAGKAEGWEGGEKPLGLVSGQKERARRPQKVQMKQKTRRLYTCGGSPMSAIWGLGTFGGGGGLTITWNSE